LKELILIYLNTEEASEKLFTTQYTIRKYIRQGKLIASKVGKHFLIAEDEIDKFLKEMTFKVKKEKRK
jgi:excisionase family DNA binding protein